MANPFSAYVESQVLFASPLELVHLAYQKAIEALGEARDHLAASRIVPRVQAVTRVQQIVIHLQASLDHEKGGDLSQTLSSLYDYMLRRLNEGNRLESDAAFAEVQQLLRTVGEAWQQIAAGDAGEMAAAATASSSASPWNSQPASPWISEPASPWNSESTSPWASEAASPWAGETVAPTASEPASPWNSGSTSPWTSEPTSPWATETTSPSSGEPASPWSSGSTSPWSSEPTSPWMNSDPSVYTRTDYSL